MPVSAVAALVLAGLALRLLPLVRDPFHQDEALYGFWGRLISTGRDPWLATVPVDKPPLVPYLIAASEGVFGANELAVRVPGLVASLLSIPLIYSLAHRLYASRSIGFVAAAVMALTPYAVLFGATAFTDPVLVMCWLAACCMVLTGRWGWTGLMLGLAFAAKQQAIALVPLVIGLGLIGFQGQVPDGDSRLRLGTQAKETTRKRLAEGAKLLLGLVLVLAGVFAWDRLRVAEGATSGFWGQGVDSYGGLRLVWSPELKSRLWGWARLEGYLLAWPWLGILFLAGLGMLLWYDFTRKRQTRTAWADLVLVAFACFYLFLHWLVAFPVWDRYLLPIVPIAALLLGRMVTVFLANLRSNRQRWRELSRRLILTFHVLLVILLAGGGLVAARGRIPVGGDHGTYDGLKDVTAFLRTLPAGTVLYDRWLSWHYDFFLYDAYVFRAGFPSPEWLATDAALFYDGRPRYLVLPEWESSARLVRALAQVDLAMSPVLATQRRDGETSFVVYEIRARDRQLD